MKICFPTQQDEGLESKVYEHFGSAPMFVVVDTDTDAASAVTNNDVNHDHGACNPHKALNGESVDLVVVSDIGAGALMNLNNMGIRVFQSQLPTVKENFELLMTGEMPEFVIAGSCCGSHDHGGHGHGEHEHGGHGHGGCGCSH
ncbi:MAG: diguanylate cyclase [Nitrospirae bacterium]|nr:diguanylate cyclase [Nitrospirota bacterium]